MAFTSAIKNSNISDNWIFQLGFYNGDSDGNGDGGFSKVTQDNGSLNLLRGALNNSDSNINVDDESVFVVGDFIKVDNEVMKITTIPTSDVITVQRGAFGTSVVSHTDNTQIYWYNFIPMAYSDIVIDTLFYPGVVTNKATIRESIDIVSSKAKTSNISINIPDYQYEGSLISTHLFGATKVFLNHQVKVLSVINNESPVEIGNFRLVKITSDGFKISINLNTHRPWDFIKQPKQKSTANIFVPLSYGNYIPNTHGTYSSGIQYYNTTNIAYRPVPYTQTNADGDRYLFHSPTATEVAQSDQNRDNARLAFYDKSLESFLPLEVNHETSTEGTNTVQYNHTARDLTRSFKHSPSDISASGGSIMNGDGGGHGGGTIAWLSSSNIGDQDNSTRAVLNVNNYGTLTDLESITSFPATSITESDFQRISFQYIEPEGQGIQGKGTALYTLVFNAPSNFSANDEITLRVYLGLFNGSWNYVFDEYRFVATASSGSGGSYQLTSGTLTDQVLEKTFNYANGDAFPTAGTVFLIIQDVTQFVHNATHMPQFALELYETKLNSQYKKSNTDVTPILYTASDGGDKSWGDYSTITRIHHMHRDLLIDYAGMTTDTPSNWTDNLNSARDAWTIRYWQLDQTTLKDLLERVQFEGAFIFRYKLGDPNKPHYIYIKDTASSVYTLSKDDIANINIETTDYNDIVTSRIVNYIKHPTENKYSESITYTDSTSPNKRVKYNIKTDENIEEVNLDMLIASVGDSDPTGENRNANFISYYNKIIGDIKLLITVDVINPTKWVNASSEPIEVGDIIGFDSTNMFPETPLGHNSSSWNNIQFIIIGTKRTLGKLTLNLREI